MIKAFFDESWNPNRPRMFAVAGILAQANEWDKIEAGWKAAIDERNAELVSQGRKPISRYHASHMNARDHEFEDWTREENAEFDQRMLSVIRGRKMYIISFAVVLDDMVKVFPAWGADTQGYAYGYAFLQCLSLCGRIAADPTLFEPGQQIRAWHDQCQWSKWALDAWERFQKDQTCSENWRFDELSHTSAVSNVCLQPADMMAYECWRESERFVLDKDTKPDMRPFFSRLVGIENQRVYATFANETHFLEMRERLEKKIAAKFSGDQKAKSDSE